MVSDQYPDTGPGRGGPGVSALLVGCPECELPAEITERFWLDSTDGPVLHICVSCVDGHYFRMAADRLPDRLGCAANVASDGVLRPSMLTPAWPDDY